MMTTRSVALVTGASSGFGKEAALALVNAGFHVVGTSRDTSAWRRTERRDSLGRLADEFRAAQHHLEVMRR